MVSILLVLAILTNLISVYVPLMQKDIIDKMGDTILDLSTIRVLLVVSLLGGFLYIYESLYLNKLYVILKNSLQNKLFKSVIRKENDIITKKGPGAYMVSIYSDTDQVASLISTNYFSIALLCITSLVIILITLNWTYSFAIIVSISYILIIMIMLVSSKYYKKEFNLARNMVYEVNPKVLELIENRSSILNHSNIQGVEASISELLDIRNKHFRRAFAIDAFSKSSIIVIKNISMILFFMISMEQIINNALEFSAFVAMVAYFSLVFNPISAIQGVINGMQRFDGLYSKISESLSIPVNTVLPENLEIKLQDCSFSYRENNDDKNVLTQLNLNIDSNIGLVGLSGEGKSTIISILFGEKELNSGMCSLGGKDVSSISKYIINSSIRLYSQVAEIFDNTLEYNVTLGKSGLSYEAYKKEITRYIALLQSIILKLENRSMLTEEELQLIHKVYLTSENFDYRSDLLDSFYKEIKQNNYLQDNLANMIVSREYYIEEKYQQLLAELKLTHLMGRNLGQRGTKISGGEKNKVTLARFLLSDLDNTYVIDEPFTSLDNISERLCMDVLKKHIAGKKGILISHKMGIIQELSDKIIVLDKGNIIAEGTHENLYESCSLYHTLVSNASRS